VGKNRGVPNTQEKILLYEVRRDFRGCAQLLSHEVHVRVKLVEGEHVGGGS